MEVMKPRPGQIQISVNRVNKFQTIKSNEKGLLFNEIIKLTPRPKNREGYKYRNITNINSLKHASNTIEY